MRALPSASFCAGAHEYADATDPLGLLRARSERPRRRTAEKRDELASLHGLPSSGRDPYITTSPREKAAVLRSKSDHSCSSWVIERRIRPVCNSSALPP